MLIHIAENVKRLRQMTATQAAILLTGLNPIKTRTLYEVDPDKRDEANEILTVILQAISLQEFNVKEAWGEFPDGLSFITEKISVADKSHSRANLVTEASFAPKDFWPWAIANGYIDSEIFPEEPLITDAHPIESHNSMDLSNLLATHTGSVDLIKQLASEKAKNEQLSQEIESTRQQRDHFQSELKKHAEELVTATQELEKIKNAMKKFREESIHGKEKQSILSIIGVMALKGYKIPIHDAKMKNTKDLLEDLQLFGVPLDPDTVRKFLKMAASIVESASEQTATKN